MYHYEVKVRYTKQTGYYNPPSVKELYVVEESTFGGAEQVLLSILKPFVFGDDIEVIAIKKVAPHDIIDCDAPEKVFKCKAVFITIEDSGKESRKPVFLYVGADDLESARKAACEHLNVYDSELLSVEETKIVDVYRYEKR